MLNDANWGTLNGLHLESRGLDLVVSVCVYVCMYVCLGILAICVNCFRSYDNCCFLYVCGGGGGLLVCFFWFVFVFGSGSDDIG